ncbi:MAG: hypothetical protein V3W20_08180 [Candidatus Neomarinimicrobiota bacterium]
MKGDKYQPSNGTEGMYFEEEHCLQCINCDPHPCGDKQCQIWCNALCYSINDPEYPEEWVYDDNDKPTCTNHVKWDWGEDGDPDDPDNPKAPKPVPDNQLFLPFVANEIESSVTLPSHKEDAESQ